LVGSQVPPRFQPKIRQLHEALDGIEQCATESIGGVGLSRVIYERR
jgi:hypothetical protein